MRIRYSLDASDYLKFQLFIASQSKYLKRRRRFVLWFIPILYILIAFFLFGREHYITMSIIMLIGVAWLLFYPIYSRKRYVRYYRRFIEDHYANNFNKDYFIETREDDFYLEAEEANSKVKYNAVKKIFNLGSHFLIQLNNGTVVILPLEKADTEELNLVINEISGKSKKIVLELKNWKWK